MRVTRRIVVFLLAGMLAGCGVRAVDANVRADRLDRTKAYVLIASRGVYQISVCYTTSCFPANDDYVFGYESGVYAFPVKVGTSFRMSRAALGLAVTENYATLSGPELTIERPGVYFYGTVANLGDKVRFTGGADPALIAEAMAKYRESLAKLPAINFQWPK